MGTAEVGNITEFNQKSKLSDDEYVDLESVVRAEMVSYRTESKTETPTCKIIRDADNFSHGILLLCNELHYLAFHGK